MAKLLLNDLANLGGNPSSAQSAINDNNEALRQALDNTLSRDGSTPNQMEADLDLNSNSLINVADPVAETDGVNLRSVRPLVEQFSSEIAETIIEGTARTEVFTATDGQTDFPLLESPGTVNNMWVTDEGLLLVPGVDYTLTGSDLKTATFFVGRTLDAQIVIRYVQLSPADSQLRSDLANDEDETLGAAIIEALGYGSGAVSRTVRESLHDLVRPEQFGGVGDGVTNDAVAMNAAIAYLNSIGWSKPLVLGSKKWRLNSPPTIITADRSPTIVGNGAQVLLEYAAGDGFTFYSGGGGAQIQNAKISGVEFDTTTVTRTSGYAVRGLNVADMRVASCTFRDQYGGVKVGVYQYPTIHDCTFLECMRGIELESGSGGTISNCRMQTGSGTTPTVGSIGLYMPSVSGVLVVNTDIVRCEVGIYGIPAAGLGVQFLFLTNTLCDTCTYGMQLSTSAGGTVSSIYATNSWFSSCSENGVYASGVKNMRLTDCEVIVNKRDGVVLLGCEQVRITGGMIGWNNTLNAASGGGVYASGVAGLSIRNALFTNKSGWVSYGATSNQKYGIILAGTASSDVTIERNAMVDHSTGDVLVSVSPTGLPKVGGNRTSRSNTIASATNISVEPMHDDFEITGTTTVQNVGLPQFKGQVIRLRTLDACTIQDGFNFKLAGNFVGTANSTLTLQAIPGTGWVEIARAII